MTDKISNQTTDFTGPGLSADFHVSELFFSRTDKRGVINSGNSVFQRISGFEWDDLLNAPHKLVRHPDMPKAVFWLLWDFLQRGEMIGAYVKNRTKAGGLYWVFAVVMPVEGGYLSVRLKPTSDLLPKIKELYHDLHKAELDAGKNLLPEASAAALKERVMQMGFANYKAFMAAALTKELMSRDKMLNSPLDDRLTAFDSMAKAVHEIFLEANELYADFRRIEQIPVNLRLQASRCEASGGPVSVISANYSNLAREALAFATRFTDFGQDILDEINSGLFMMGAARIQREMWTIFQEEHQTDNPLDVASEMALLETYKARSGTLARSTVARIQEKSENFIEDSRRMRRFIGGLDVTRVTCRIETGWLPDDDGGFHDIISKLDAFHEDVERRMKRIDSLNDNIIERASALLNRRKLENPNKNRGGKRPPMAAASA